MRILFLCNPWAITREPARLVGTHPDLRNGRHQWVRAVGGAPVIDSDISFDMRRDNLGDLSRRYPGGPPDVMIVWAPGYQALPTGIEEAPFPVVACFSDWPLVMPEQAGMLDVYDAIFTDRAGVRMLQHMGSDRVEYWPMYGHDPVLSRVIPGVEKVWDIGLIGNLSPVVQRERAPWLARVARLADRYRVRIAGGVFNEEYTRMLNATKITFNRAFRIAVNETLPGAMNMRCYEAAACGSLLFCEEENEEIRDFFDDRVHCVLYNENNLEDLLDYYLAHDDERERICVAAAERIAEFSLPRNLTRLVDRLGELDLPARVKARRAGAVPKPEMGKRHARQAAGVMTLGSLGAANGYLEAVVDANPEDAAAQNDLAVLRSLLVGRTPVPARQMTALALQSMRRAIELCPESAFFRLNLAHMQADTGWIEAALEHVQEALALLNNGQEDPADPLCLPFPFTWDEFRVQNSMLFCATRSSPECFPPLRHCLLLYRGGMLLGRLAEEQGLPEIAALGYRVAVTARADLGSGHIALARMLAGFGEADQALAHLGAGLAADPFLTEGWTLGARLMTRQGQELAGQAFIRERLIMLDALAPPEERLAMSAALSELDAVRAALTEMLQREPVVA